MRDNSSLRNMIKALNVFARRTRPDIGSSVGTLRQFSNKPTNIVVHLANCAFGYLRDTCNYGLTILLYDKMNRLGCSLIPTFQEIRLVGNQD